MKINDFSKPPFFIACNKIPVIHEVLQKKISVLMCKQHIKHIHKKTKAILLYL